MRRRFNTEAAQARSKQKARKRQLLGNARARGDAKLLGDAVAANVALREAAVDAAGKRAQTDGERQLKRASGGRWYVVTKGGEWRRAPDELAAEAELYARRCETAKTAGDEQPLWPARLTQLVQQFNKIS